MGRGIDNPEGKPGIALVIPKGLPAHIIMHLTEFTYLQFCIWNTKLQVCGPRNESAWNSIITASEADFHYPRVSRLG